LIADISPWNFFVAIEGVYQVTGYAPGATEFTIKWVNQIGPFPGTTGYCPVEVRVGVPEWAEGAAILHEIGGLGATRFEVSWPTPAEGTASQYEVRVNGQLRVVTAVPSAMVDGLLPGTSYDVTVVACNENGCSEPLSARLETDTLLAALHDLEREILFLRSFSRGPGEPYERSALLQSAFNVLEDGNPSNDRAAIQPLETLRDNWAGWGGGIVNMIDDIIAGIEATTQSDDWFQPVHTDEEGCILWWSSSGAWPTTSGSPGFIEIRFDHWNDGQHYGPIDKETTIPLPAYGDYIDVDGPWSGILGDDLTDAVTYNFATVRNVTPHQLYVNVESDGDDSWVAWVNGLESGIWNGQQAVGPPHSFRVSEEAVLEPGLNFITVKLLEGGGGAGFRLRLTDKNDEPLLDDGKKITIEDPPVYVLDPSFWE
jgi:hypothetical protein